MRKVKGFILGQTLILILALLIMGLTGLHISWMGFRTLSAEQRWHIVDRAANGGIMRASERIINGIWTCGLTSNETFGLANLQIKTQRAGNSCFIWTRADYRNATVVKIALLYYTLEGPSNLGAVNLKRLNNINLGGSASIVSCEVECKTPALMIGNIVTITNVSDNVTACPNNPNGIISTTKAYVSNAFPQDRDLTADVFQLNNRLELLNRFSNDYRVDFDNNGKPSGIVGSYISITDQNGGLLANAVNPQRPPSHDVCSASYNNCEASGTVISCIGNTKLDFHWDLVNSRYIVKNKENITINGINYNPNTTLAYCQALDLGNNAHLQVGSFIGGGFIAANQVSLGTENNQNINSLTGLNFIVKNIVLDQKNNLTLEKVNIFAQNINLNDNGLNWYNGILYSGGSGTGNFDINLNSNSKLGSQEKPVLIISDNNLNISRNGNAEINGLIYVTDRNNNFNIGSGNGNFNINGMIVSNSNNNNNFNISGNFAIKYNRQVINNLALQFSFIKGHICEGVIRNSNFHLIQTKMRVY
ncbi:MAG: hypothetical protein N2Z40_07625 [Caldimicrobium sp.]|nr:hypothetical protein [Caldimicrobium sp.]